MSKQSVKQIVERCQQGDREAFGLLYTAMADKLRQVCRRYVSDEDTVDDLLHDSFVLIFSKIDTIKYPSKADVWMQKVTQNLALVYVQQHKQEPLVSFDDLKEPISVTTQPASPVSYQEILKLVDALPNSYRQVFRLSVLEGMSHQEIADLLNIEPHTSSAELVRAKKRLRQSLTIFLLGLLCISLPLGWYWLNQQKATSETEPVAKATKNDSKPQESSVPPVSPLGADSVAVPSKLGVRPVRTVSEVPALSDSLPSLIAEHTGTDTVKVQEEQEQQAVPQSRPEQRNSDIDVPEIPIRVTTHHGEWSVQLAYSGINHQQSFNLPYGEQGMNDPETDTITHHRIPLTIGLSVNKMLNRQLSLGTGLQYTQLYSETQTGNTYAKIQQQQRLHYLGIPLRVGWHPVRTRHWNVYGTAQAMLELPLYSTLQSHSYVGGLQVEAEKLRLSPKVQWSLGIGAGLEYRLTPVIGIYAEPSLQYFFKSGDGLDSWRTKHPAAFSVPLGIRITFE